MANDDTWIVPETFEELQARCKTLEAARKMLGENYYAQAMSEPLEALLHCCSMIALADWGCKEHAAYEFILKQRQEGFTQ